LAQLTCGRPTGRLAVLCPAAVPHSPRGWGPVCTHRKSGSHLAERLSARPSVPVAPVRSWWCGGQLRGDSPALLFSGALVRFALLGEISPELYFEWDDCLTDLP